MFKLIGELVSLFGSSIEVYERGIKSYEKSMRTGILRYAVQSISYLFLGGWNGLVITAMAIVRSLFMLKKRFTAGVMAAWLAVSGMISLYAAQGVADIFPFLATTQFTLMARKQNGPSLKKAQVINSMIWFVYHASHLTYVYMAVDVVLIIVGVLRLKKGVEG